ncbi:hypothetical protein XELAEV_18028402mg [Xenopus laevis]|uniref:Uncharacterized protein n=1 Tax=Xenopus laevis TaxID=8355 RepID=A0A974CXD1_XENLA|nr:hypothetical protein XELAEV_18028402mg [Xenopus laevis]
MELKNIAVTGWAQAMQPLKDKGLQVCVTFGSHHIGLTPFQHKLEPGCIFYGYGLTRSVIRLVALVPASAQLV